LSHNSLAAMAFGALLVGASAASASPRVILDAPVPGALEAGDRATVRWDGVPGTTDELELLLEIGPGVTLRLTDELDPDSGTFAWTVPNLSVDEARIVLRMDVEGREVEAGVSAPFGIRRAGAAAAAELQLRGGEVWVLDALRARPGESRLPRAKLTGTARRRLKAQQRETPASLPGPTAAPSLNAERAASTARVRRAADEPPAPFVSDTLPVSFPRRI
jgi:hypothetical protein